MTALEKRPGLLLKFLFKFPIWLHRMGLGGWERLMGAQWMLITTVGRRSGKRRDAMVDVMQYDKDTDTYYIEVAYGERADYYRNIQVNPVFDVVVGRRKFRARAAELSPDRTADMLVQFYRQKPAYTRSVMAMVGMKFTSEDDLRALAPRLKLLAIQPEK